MTREFERPHFLKSYLSALSRSADRRGWLAVIPYWVVFFVIIGSGAAYRIPSDFWSDRGLDVSVPVYVGILTVNGLVLALSWGAFSRIYDSLGQPGFRGFLRKYGLMEGYIVHVGYINIVQVFAILISFIGIVVLLFRLDNHDYNRAIFGLMLGSSLYAVKQASAAVTIMHDLAWQQAEFDDLPPADTGDRIVKMRKD